MSEEKFKRAVQIVNNLPKDGPYKPSQNDQLYFYKYYKQATVGDVNVPRPSGLFEFEGKAKWDAWESVKGQSKEDAYQAYVAKLIEALKEAGGNEELVAELEEGLPAAGADAEATV